MKPSTLRLLSIATLLAWHSAPSWSQSISVSPLSSTPVPVDHPLALLGAGAVAAWLGVRALRQRGLPVQRILSGCGSILVVGLAAAVFWSDTVQAQWKQLERYFTQAAAQTETIPIEATTDGNGVVTGFLPVVFTNQTTAALRVDGITLPRWDTCFPDGIPTPLPVQVPLAQGRQCTVGTALNAQGGTCWIDTAQLCATAASNELGSAATAAVPDTATTVAGQEVTGNVLANDSDPDSTLVVTQFATHGTVYRAGQTATSPVFGSFTLQRNGQFSFTPPAHFSASVFLASYTTHTGAGSTLQIQVTAPNKPPVAQNDSASTVSDTAVRIPVRWNDSDPDGDALSVKAVTQPLQGSVHIDLVTGDPVYTPHSGYVGEDRFGYTVSDGKGGESSAEVTVTVTALNRGPTAVDDNVQTLENTAITVAVKDNDSDPDNDPLRVTAVTQGTQGAVVVDSVTGNPVYTPNTGFVGIDSFHYTVEDTGGLSSTAKVTVTVLDTSTPSVMKPEVIDIPEDASIIGNLLGNDSDPDSTLVIARYEIAGQSYLAGTKAPVGTAGEITVDSSGFFIFKSTANYFGTAPVITYFTDRGYSSTLTVRVTPTNDAPQAVDDEFTTDEDTPLTLPVATLLGNDSDVDGDMISLFSLGSATNGDVALSGSDVVFTPALNFSGTASFLYTITDGNAKFSSATVTINVLPVDDPAVMTPEVVEVPAGLSILGNVLANDQDPDSERVIAHYEVLGATYPADAKAVLTGLTGYGEITVGGSGTFIFKSSADYSGPVPVITYFTTTGASSTLTITVTPSGNAPRQ